MLTPVYNPAKGKLRVIGYASGSGNTLWKAYEMQKEMGQTPEGCPFEIVGVFSSDGEEGKAVATAKQLGLPYVAMDIHQYYKDREKPLKDREVRAEYDREALEKLEPFGADLILLAGYVWATTDQVLDRYTVVNVHPADLSIMKDGKRAYAGADGVGGALKAGEAYLGATSHLATKVLDGGPILVISEKVPVDYALHSEYDDRFRHYLKLVNDQNRLVGARTLLELALGNFSVDDAGALYYKGQAAPTGVRIESWEQDKPLYQRHTEALFAPKSVAVVGASQKPGIGHATLKNLLDGGFGGRVYAVNVRAEAVLGAPGYATVEDIPEEVDMAILTVPSGAVLGVAEQCGRKGVKALVCVSAGFKEVGEEGRAAEVRLMEIVNRYNMRMIGPNCMGLMNTGANLNATILSGEIVRGNVAFVTQSGAIGAAMLDSAGQTGIGFSTMVSLGNQADVNTCDILPLLDRDPNTKVILFYLESILEPVRFYRIASRMKKPVLLIKSGRTSAGASAASSHTGSLAGNDSVVNALIEKAGVRRMESIEESFIAAAALSRMPDVKGKRVALLTNAGGPGILITDALSKAGFELPGLPEDVQRDLAGTLLKEASTKNPVDIVAPAPPEHYAAAAEKMLATGLYDALLVCCVPPATVDTAKVAEALVPVLQKSELPVLTNFFGPTLGCGARDVMRKNHIPTFTYPEEMVTGLASLRPVKAYDTEGVYRADAGALQTAARIVGEAQPGDYLPTLAARELLEAFGVRVAKSALLTDPAEIANLGLAYPVVAKIDHPEIVHKSDVGGVVVGIATPEELREVAEGFLSKFAGARGVYVQEMVPAGIELIVGSSGDEDMGSSLMVGYGGTMVEVFKDVVFGYAPISEELAGDMIRKLKCLPLLEGYRGQKGLDLRALARMLTAVGNMLLAAPHISELDLNPVLYDEAKGAFVAADCRIRIA